MLTETYNEIKLVSAPDQIGCTILRPELYVMVKISECTRFNSASALDPDPSFKLELQLFHGTVCRAVLAQLL